MKKYKIRTCVRVPKIVVLVALMLLCVFAARIVAGKITGFAGSILEVYNDYKAFATDTLRDVDVETFYTSNATKIYFADGTLLTTLSRADKHNYIEYDDLPLDVAHAFISIEDKRYYLHRGVDWKSTCYAGAMEVLTHGNSGRGGSTITQQLARNKFLTFERSYERKLKEIFLATELEKKFDKDQIMEFYVNTINFSNNYYGIGSAALGYFGKSISECSLSEIALLCAIPNNPTVYNPRTNLKNTISRRNLILREMYANGFISNKQYLKAIKSKPKIQGGIQDKFYNYESSYAVKCTVDEIMHSNGFKFRYAFNSTKSYKRYNKKYEAEFDRTLDVLKGCGYTVKTSLDRDIQKTAQNAINEQLAHDRRKQKDKVFLLQGAATVIDNSTGYVVGIVGGRSQNGITNNGINTFNRAYQSYRQPGSTIKPLIVYAPAIESGMRPDDMVEDKAIKNGPHNSDGKYLGEISLRYAVEKSRNTVAWSLFESNGIDAGLKKLESMQYSRILPEDHNLAAALGGFTKGVSTVEMASAYAALENKGVFRSPTCVVSILTMDGEERCTNRARKRIYSQVAAEYMTDILTGVATEGTAAGLTIGNGIPIACKTGTTNNNVSGWFCGYSPYYTCAVYVGADDGSGTSGLYGSTDPKNIWRSIQEDLCSGKKVIAFDLNKIQQTEYEATDMDDVDIEDVHGDIFSDGNEDLVGKENGVSDTMNIQGEVEKSEKPEEPEEPDEIIGEIKKPDEPEEPDEPSEGLEEPSTDSEEPTDGFEEPLEPDEPEIPSDEPSVEPEEPSVEPEEPSEEPPVSSDEIEGEGTGMYE